MACIRKKFKLQYVCQSIALQMSAKLGIEFASEGCPVCFHYHIVRANTSKKKDARKEQTRLARVTGRAYYLAKYGE